MNIAVFADIHGRIALSFKLCARWEKETGQKLDLILQAGDLGVFPDESRLDKATIRHAEKDPTEPGFLNDFLHERPEIAAILSQTSGNMIFVRGNHEDHHWLDGLEDRRQGALFPVDAYRQPAYHFFGHYGGPCRQGTDSNGKTLACKLADLDWDYTDRGKVIEPGAMGLLRWKNQSEHAFEVIDQPWLKEYNAFTWNHL